jgi:hypothetical protein
MRSTELVVDPDGLVGCPNRGDVPVAECVVCAALDSVDHAGSIDVVVCRPQAARLPRRARPTPESWFRVFAPSG